VKMDIRKQRLSLEEARQTDIVNYLSSLGYEPVKTRNNDYWYLSPLRTERTPSFKVNRKLNRWYDHGIGKGGNLLDFGTLYYNCTIGELLDNLGGNLSFHQLHFVLENRGKTESKITILKESAALSFALCRYLNQRNILVEVAEQFCKEVRYELNGKEYFAIGFKNDAGGYELRNSYSKLSSSPKDITTFQNGCSQAVVFEGFMDFLSFNSIHKNAPFSDHNFVVLNSVSFFEKARPFMEQHETIRLYLDRDSTGHNYSRYALSLSQKYKDESALYKHHKDLNDWVINFGKTPKKETGTQAALGLRLQGHI
jgi:hypothetical protein